jgi:small-conductance mechanosensitive channel
MNSTRNFLFSVITFCVILLTIVPYHSLGQDIDLTAKDTTLLDPETIDLSEISRKSAELTLAAREIISQAIDQVELDNLKRSNREVIHSMDSLISRESIVNMTNLSNRNLNSKLNYWKQNLKTVKDQQSNLSDVFSELNENHNYLKDEMEIWEKTNELIQGDELSEAVNTHFVDIKIIVDTTKKVIDQKSVDILKLLDEITSLEVQIESLINTVEHVIFQKQENIFNTDQSSLWRLKYGETKSWLIPKSYLSYYTGNYVFFKDYLSKHMGILIFQILLIVSLTMLFIKLNKIKFEESKMVGAFYVKRLKVLISNPLSVAVIIGLFSNVFLYPYRPIMFLDITNILLTIPIIIILVHTLKRKYHVYAYVFGLSVILYVLFLNLPINHIYARMTLLLITSLQTATLFYFIFSSRKTKGLNDRSIKFFTYFSYLLLIMSMIAFMANIIGKVSLSSYLAQAILGILLITIIITFTLIVANGLVVIFVESKYGSTINFIKNNKAEVSKRVISFFRLVAVLLFIYFILDLFKFQGVVIDWLSDFFLADRKLGSVEFTWGNIFLFFVVIYLSILLAGIIRALLEEDVFGRIKMKKGLPYTIGLMVKYSIVTAGIFLAVSAAGIPTTSLTVILGAFGVGIGFGLQNIFNNLVSGLILLFERPIQLGDAIEVGTMMGHVKSIGIRSSNVRTFDGAEIIVPNGNLISNNVINWTLSDDRRRIELIVGVSYNSDPHKVKEILLNIIENHEDIITDPKPSVFFYNLGESSLDFRMLFWTKEFDQWYRIKSEITFKVFDDLKKAGIEIPFPQRDLHLRSVDKNINLKN